MIESIRFAVAAAILAVSYAMHIEQDVVFEMLWAFFFAAGFDWLDKNSNTIGPPDGGRRALLP